jgi:histidinol-phosphate phosphatase family protein
MFQTNINEYFFMHKFDNTWTLFLDRDGVINQRIPGDYVKSWDDFDFIPGSIKAIENLSSVFGRIVVVTNQAGIGKGLMTEKQLFDVHRMLLKTVDLLDGRIDKIYYAPDLPNSGSILRKPNIGMAKQAKQDFPEINFANSVIVGDSISDMEFGENLGMVKVFVDGKGEDPSSINPDYRFDTLFTFAKFVKETHQL